LLLWSKLISKLEQHLFDQKNPERFIKQPPQLPGQPVPG